MKSKIRECKILNSLEANIRMVTIQRLYKLWPGCIQNIDKVINDIDNDYDLKFKKSIINY